MSRSLKKGIYVQDSLMKKVEKARSGEIRGPIKTWSRRSTVIPEMVGLKLAIHNGRKHVEVLITEAMVGHRLGEFAHTRTFRAHSSKKEK